MGTLYGGNGAYQFPDYVFEENYPLLTIEELKAFISKEKHLPKVTSRDEYEKAGSTFDFAKMAFMSLEKVEEAHLYILQLHETIKEEKEKRKEIEKRSLQLHERIEEEREKRKKTEKEVEQLRSVISDLVKKVQTLSEDISHNGLRHE